MSTRYTVLDQKTESREDRLAQKIIAEAIRLAVDECYELGLLDPKHDIVSCSLEVKSDVPGKLS